MIQNWHSSRISLENRFRHRRKDCRKKTQARFSRCLQTAKTLWVFGFSREDVSIIENDANSSFAQTTSYLGQRLACLLRDYFVKCWVAR